MWRARTVASFGRADSLGQAEPIRPVPITEIFFALMVVSQPRSCCTRDARR
jgi:hypothetical protein